MSARVQPSLEELYVQFQELLETQARQQQRKNELIATIDELTKSLSTAKVDLIEANLALQEIEHRRGVMTSKMGEASLREHGASGVAGSGGGQLPSLVFMQ